MFRPGEVQEMASPLGGTETIIQSESYVPGSILVLQNLQAAHALNGQYVRVRKFHSKLGRYQVDLLDNPNGRKPLSVLPTNLGAPGAVSSPTTTTTTSDTESSKLDIQRKRCMQSIYTMLDELNLSSLQEVVKELTTHFYYLDTLYTDRELHANAEKVMRHARRMVSNVIACAGC